jgi:hypothetical protein
MEKRLFIFVEGLDDARFFRSIVKPRLKGRYRSVEIVMYACMKHEKATEFVRGIRKMGHDYIIAADIDQAPTVQEKKGIVRGRFYDAEWSRIFVVVMEIESWYLAGLKPEDAARLGIPELAATDGITKEDFNRLMPRAYRSRIAFLIDLTRYFSSDAARIKNRSFDFFAGHLFL